MKKEDVVELEKISDELFEISKKLNSFEEKDEDNHFVYKDASNSLRNVCGDLNSLIEGSEIKSSKKRSVKSHNIFSNSLLIKSSDIKKKIDGNISIHKLPVECLEATITDGHLNMTIVEYLKGYDSSKSSERVVNGEGDGESFKFDDFLSEIEAICLPYLVKSGPRYPTNRFQDVYKRSDAVPYNSATIHIIKEYD